MIQCRMKCEGHVASNESFRNSHQVLFGKPESFKEYKELGTERSALVKANFMDSNYVVHESVQWQDIGLCVS